MIFELAGRGETFAVPLPMAAKVNVVGSLIVAREIFNGWCQALFLRPGAQPAPEAASCAEVLAPCVGGVRWGRDVLSCINDRSLRLLSKIQVLTYYPYKG